MQSAPEYQFCILLIIFDRSRNLFRQKCYYYIVACYINTHLRLIRLIIYKTRFF